MHNHKMREQAAISLPVGRRGTADVMACFVMDGRGGVRVLGIGGLTDGRQGVRVLFLEREDTVRRR